LHLETRSNKGGQDIVRDDAIVERFERNFFKVDVVLAFDVDALGSSCRLDVPQLHIVNDDGKRDRRIDRHDKRRQ
jgi:hypothetical protein